jgi:GNAT superfamily N-acetyltransferase
MGGKLTIRLARPDDRADVERICAATWDWGDYVPEAWDHWLAEQARAQAGDFEDTGVVLAGEWAGRMVALSRIRHQTPEQIWLEAMRVEPEYRRRGIAGEFLSHSLAYARQKRAKVVRLGTSERNTPVHIMTDRTGMVRAGSYVLWNAEALLASPLPVVLSTDHAVQVWAFLDESPVLAHTKGLYSSAWNWQELSPQRVAQFLDQRAMVAKTAVDGQLLAVATTYLESEGKVLWVGFVDGESQAVGQLAGEIRAHAAQAGADRVRIMLPDVGWLREAWGAAGYSSGDWEGELFIYEHWVREKPEGQAVIAGQEGNPGSAGGRYGD